MNGCAQLVNWKMLSRGLPRGRQAANDRAPTVEEIQRLVQYPDRRIKPIVSTMVSSGMRIGGGIIYCGSMYYQSPMIKEK